MNRVPASVLVATTVVLWATAFPAIRVALESTSPLALSFCRLFIAAIVLLAAGVVTKARVPARSDLPQIALCGATGMAAYQLLLNVGERTVPAGTASVIVATAPVYSLIVASRLLGERIPNRRWVGLSVAVLGSAAVALTAGGAFSMHGAAIAVVAAAIVQGLYHAAQRPLLSRYTALEVATYAMTAGAMMLVPTLPWVLGSAREISARSWMAIGFLALGPSALGFVTWAGAVGRLQVSRPAIALYAVPVVAVVVAWAWIGERPKLPTLLAGGVALIGVAIGTLARPKHNGDGEPVENGLAENRDAMPEAARCVGDDEGDSLTIRQLPRCRQVAVHEVRL